MTDFMQLREKMNGLDAASIFFTDLNGRIMSLPVNPENIESIMNKGIGFDGSSVAGFASVDKSDRLLFPDPKSFRIVKFKNETLGFFTGCVYNELGERAKADPRRVLEEVIQQAETKHGFQFLLGPEHEFFLLSGDEFEKKEHTDNGGYFQPTPHDKGESIRNQIIATLKACGINFEKSHHEVTPPSMR